MIDLKAFTAPVIRAAPSVTLVTLLQPSNWKPQNSPHLSNPTAPLNCREKRRRQIYIDFYTDIDIYGYRSVSISLSLYRYRYRYIYICVYSVDERQEHGGANAADQPLVVIRV